MIRMKDTDGQPAGPQRSDLDHQDPESGSCGQCQALKINFMGGIIYGTHCKGTFPG